MEIAEKSKETASGEVGTAIFLNLVLADILYLINAMSRIKAGLILRLGLQSQEGNRSPDLYSSKYGTLGSLTNRRFSQLKYEGRKFSAAILANCHTLYGV